jgi:hypothetical protein
MPEEEEVVIHFLPMLGQMLEAAEKNKGAMLTEEEIIQTRDDAPAIVLRREDFEKIDASRTLHDIDPQNVAYEWNRRRIEFVQTYWPQLVLYVLTKDSATKNCQALLEEADVTYDLKGSEPTLAAELMAKNSRLEPRMTAKDAENMAGHTNYFVVRSEQFKSDEARHVSIKFLRLIGRLINAGALGVSVESSHLSHSNAAWKTLLGAFEECLSKGESGGEQLLYAFVQSPLVNENLLFTCGMHSLGEPDCLIESETLLQAGIAEKHLNDMADRLFLTHALYLMEECTRGEFQSGNTFSLDRNSPRLRVRIEPCSFFQESDIRFNPFGIWRFTLP